MKIYVASALDNWFRILQYEKVLQELGHEITYSWATDYEKQLAGTLPRDIPGLGEQCRKGVLDCDTLILVCRGGRGAHVEYGIALGSGKRALIVLENPEMMTTMYLSPAYASFEAVLDELEKV